MQVTNRSKEAMQGLVACFSFNAELYSMPACTLQLPVLVPQLEYSFHADFKCVAPETGATGEMLVSVVRRNSGSIVMATKADVPVSEVDEE